MANFARSFSSGWNENLIFSSLYPRPKCVSGISCFDGEIPTSNFHLHAADGILAMHIMPCHAIRCSLGLPIIRNFNWKSIVPWNIRIYYKHTVRFDPREFHKFNWHDSKSRRLNSSYLKQQLFHYAQVLHSTQSSSSHKLNQDTFNAISPYYFHTTNFSSSLGFSSIFTFLCKPSNAISQFSPTFLQISLLVVTQKKTKNESNYENFRHTRNVAERAESTQNPIRTERQTAFEWTDFHTRCMILF